MRPLFLFAIAAVSVFFAWSWYQPVCEGGRVVASEDECRAVAIFDRDFCQKAWSRTAAIASVSGPSYKTRTECDDDWPVCIDREPAGFVPKPAGWCLVRGASGEPTRTEPQYERKRG